MQKLNEEFKRRHDLVIKSEMMKADLSFARDRENSPKWLVKLMDKNISVITQIINELKKHRSEINPYATTISDTHTPDHP